MNAPDEPQAAPVERSLNSNGARFHLLEWGRATAKPLLCLHGGSANAHWWHFVAQSLCDRFRVIAPDLRGHGGSTASADSRYTVAGHAADVAAIAATLQLRDVTLIGHSYGGFVSLACLDRMADRLRELVLVDSRPVIREHSVRYMAALAKFPHPVYRDLPQARERFALLPKGTSASREILDYIVERSVVPCDRGWTLSFDRHALNGLAPQSYLDTLQRFRGRILLVRGQHSTALSARAFTEMRRQVAGAQAVEIPGAYHHVMLDEPKRLAEALRHFLDGTPAPPTAGGAGSAV